MNRSAIAELVRENLEFVLARCEAHADYGFADLKFNVLTGREFPAGSGDVHDRDVIYGIIQGRAVEAFARHAQWLGDDPLAGRCRAVLARVVERVEALRVALGGHLYFMMSARRAERLPVATLADAPTLTDLFHAKGLLAAARCLDDAALLTTADAYLWRTATAALAGTLVNDLEPMDPKNPVRDVPGRQSHAWMMLALGGVATAVEAGLDDRWRDLGARLWRTIVGVHVNRGQWPELAPLDFVEFVDPAGRPWRDEQGRVWCDPGHAIEFVGLSARFADAGKVGGDLRAATVSGPDRRPEVASHVWDVRAPVDRGPLPGLLRHVFGFAWNAAAGGICKSFDLVGRAPINSDLPWWSLPETIRAASLLGDTADIADTCWQAYLEHYVRPEWGRLPIQTRAATGDPVDVIPAMPDADPLYHTGVSLIDVLERGLGGGGPAPMREARRPGQPEGVAARRSPPTLRGSTRRVLCTWDAGIDAGVYAPLDGIAELDRHPADVAWLREHIGDYDVYLPSLKVPVDADLAARGAAGRLRLVYTPSTGTDHLDVAALAAHGIEVRSLKTEIDLLDRVTATAELALALLLAVVRRLPAAHGAALRGDWARDALRGRQLAGKTLGVLGVGRLGRMMVAYGRGLGLQVIGCDPAPARPVPGLTYLPFPEFAAHADLVSVHVHLNAETRHFLNAKRLALLKPGAVLVNTSRGAIVDETALLAALESGHIAGYGTDVIDGEWDADLAAHPLIAYARAHDNVVVTPHVGGVTDESQTITHRFVVEQTASLLARGLGWATAGRVGCGQRPRQVLCGSTSLGATSGTRSEAELLQQPDRGTPVGEAALQQVEADKGREHQPPRTHPMRQGHTQQHEKPGQQP